MRKNGFTLIELLAVITILGILALIATVSVGGILSRSRTNISDIQKKNIEAAAQDYFVDTGMSDSLTCVTLNTLLTEGYIEGTEVKDPKTGSTMTGSVAIAYNESYKQYTFTYQDTGC